MAALKNGFTTGSAAAAAAMSALSQIRSKHFSAVMDVPLPPFQENQFLAVPIARVGTNSDSLAYAEVRKDGGDDPDATHGMIIRADIYQNNIPGIKIVGGKGIGRVTLPGLPVPPGQAAINPVPKAQIIRALHKIAPDLTSAKIVISAPEGEERAKKTLNARLGIIGGISILGTQGIVKPYSNAAWIAGIREALDVAKASGCECICFGTGRRSVNLLEKKYSGLPSQAFIVAGDYVKDSLKMAAGFKNIVWGCFIGKLVKMAQGNGNTHAHGSSLDLQFLAKLLDMPILATFLTANAALTHILAINASKLEPLIYTAQKQARIFSGRQIKIHLFHTDGRELATA